MATSTPALSDRGAASGWAWCARLGLAGLAVVLTWNAIAYLASAAQAIAFPYELDYGEGVVWQQIHLLLSGDGYGPIDGFPAIVFHYPPLYHLATAALAAITGMDELAAGRLLSVGATLAMAGFATATIIALSADRVGRLPAWTGGFLGAAATLNILPVQSWSYLMRVDMLSIALGLAGFYFGLRSLVRPGAIHLAAALFVAAVYTKQTAVAAPVAVFAVLLVLRPRTAWMGIATGAILGFGALAFVTWLTDGGFLHHIVSYNINRFNARGLLDIIVVLVLHLAYIIAALLGIYTWQYGFSQNRLANGERQNLPQRLRASPVDAGHVMALVYLTLTTLMLALATKSGASINYFIEWGCTIILFGGVALTNTAATATGSRMNTRAGAATALLPLFLILQAHQLWGKADERLSAQIPRQQEMARVVELVRSARRPVVSDDMVVVLRGGKPVVWEPAIFAELASNGTWDERPFLERIGKREFAFFITIGQPGNPLYDDRHSPAVSRAIETFYPVERSLGAYHLHFPAMPLPPYAVTLP